MVNIPNHFSRASYQVQLRKMRLTYYGCRFSKTPIFSFVSYRWQEAGLTFKTGICKMLSKWIRNSDEIDVIQHYQDCRVRVH